MWKCCSSKFEIQHYTGCYLNLLHSHICTTYVKYVKIGNYCILINHSLKPNFYLKKVKKTCSCIEMLSALFTASYWLLNPQIEISNPTWLFKYVYIKCKVNIFIFCEYSNVCFKGLLLHIGACSLSEKCLYTQI